jgi:hypothetical protein
VGVARESQGAAGNETKEAGHAEIDVNDHHRAQQQYRPHVKGGKGQVLVQRTDQHKGGCPDDCNSSAVHTCTRNLPKGDTGIRDKDDQYSEKSYEL